MMIESVKISPEGAEYMPLREYTERAYLEYAMYVILDRALPNIADGLKPVQRRIVYAMSELGLKAAAKYKKSARTVGDVLGKFHPHGDSACYEAMVLMAQPFSYRYPLVDGQGNWGSPDDPKSFAAMRYTESRLTKYAELLLSELGLGTVDWHPNFDGTLKEPALLPARVPNILLNGSSGIAVGMATDIPPHNLREVVAACIHLLSHPDADTAALCEFIQGPDYPTPAEIITPREDLLRMYETGHGSVRMRAVFEKESSDIVITALPHQVSVSKIMEQVAAQMQAKKLPLVADLRDESDHEDPTRLVIVPRSNRVDTEMLMAHLFATTDLEKTYRVNMNLIGLNGKPGVRPLPDLLREWLTFRRQTVTRRLQHRLDRITDRLHILDGLLMAFLNIDEVIAIIRTEEHPKPVLMQVLNITERQAEAILDLKLRHLAKLEEMKIRTEQAELSEERERLEMILGSEKRLTTLIRKELEADAKAYGDDRRSPVVERGEAQALNESDLLPSEPVTVVMSAGGWVRTAKGHEMDPSQLNYKAGDTFKAAARGRSNQEAVFIDSTGRSYSLTAHSMPSARSQGEPLSGRLNLPSGATVEMVLMGADDGLWLIASNAGYGFVAKTTDLICRNKTGKALLNLPGDSTPLPPVPIHHHASDLLAALTSEGRMLIFPVKDLPRLAKGKGNKIIHIPPQHIRSGQESVILLLVFSAEDSLVVYSGKRKMTLPPVKLVDYYGEQGRRGKKLPAAFRKFDLIEVIAQDSDDDDENIGKSDTPEQMDLV